MADRAFISTSGPSSFPGHWRVRIFERDHPRRDLVAFLGESPPTPSGGGGGWEAVALPKRRPVTVWRQGDLFVQSVPIIIGSWADDPLEGVDGHHSINADRQRLVDMWRPDSPVEEPPVVKVNTIGDAVMFQQLDYVVSGLEWGDTLASNEMQRVMQKVTVTLLEYRPDERLETQRQSAAKRRKAKTQKKSKAKSKPYIVRAGDSLSSIAQRKHVVGGAAALGRAQTPPITEPRSLRVGQHLRIP